MIALGGNEMGPRTDNELVVIFFILVTMVFVNAQLFGEMTVLVQASSAKATKFQEQVDVANTAMTSVNMPFTIKEDVRTYLMETQGT
jgi:hypothetical protein